MTDSFKSMEIDSALFQLQATGTSRPLANATGERGTNQEKCADLEQASRQFESLLLNFMIREMRATVPDSAIFPPSMAQDIFTSMLDEQYADNLSERGGIGLSRLIVDQLKDGAKDD